MAAKTITAELKGGDALERHLKGIAKHLGKGATVAVGFLESETYPGGTYHFTKARLKQMSPETRQFAQFLRGKKKFAGPVAQVAFWNEFGTKRSPPRPFMRHTVASKSGRWGVALGHALKHTDYDTRTALAMLGEKIQGQMRESIANWTEPANSKTTRELKGFNSPLRDSGVMMRAVDYQVIDGEGG